MLAVVLVTQFQSTLPHGSDFGFLLLRSRHRDFNPRSLTGATLKITLIPVFPLFQSTLPHGSDSALSIRVKLSRHFNPRSLTGATLTALLSIRPLSTFQSTLPHGSDSYNNQQTSLSYEFQSTLPHGSDKSVCSPVMALQHFNPRSLTGATIYTGQFSRTSVFQSTLPHGSDHQRSRQC